MADIFRRDSGLMKFMTWLSDMAHIQLLWVFFSLVGLVIGGFFPATFAMFAVQRKLIRLKETSQLNRLFWEEYKTNFMRSNAVGYALTGLVAATLAYVKFSQNVEGPFSTAYRIFSLGMGIIILLLILYTGPVAAHYDISPWQTLRHAFIVEISCPVHTLGILGVVILFRWSAGNYPVLVPLVSISISAYLIMWIACHAFEHLRRAAENKKN